MLDNKKALAASLFVFHVYPSCKCSFDDGWVSRFLRLNYLRLLHHLDHLHLLTPKERCCSCGFFCPNLSRMLHLVRRFLLLGQGDFVESLMDALHEEI